MEEQEKKKTNRYVTVSRARIDKDTIVVQIVFSLIEQVKDA
jgi:hypothetical protein